MTGAPPEAQHAEPVWRDRADFIVVADISGYSEAAGTEQLWARQIGENRFELCCIPFFAYDLALGDVVETAPAKGRVYMISRVVQPSGRFVFRVWLGDSGGARDDIVDKLVQIGALLEWSSIDLLAVDAGSTEIAQRVADYLHEAESTGALVYETGRTA